MGGLLLLKNYAGPIKLNHKTPQQSDSVSIGPTMQSHLGSYDPSTSFTVKKHLKRLLEVGCELPSAFQTLGDEDTSSEFLVE